MPEEQFWSASVDFTPEAERWEDVPGFEGYYAVSDLGRVKSLARKVWVAPSIQAPDGCYRPVRERVLSPSRSKGWYHVLFSVDGVHSTHAVHHLVLEAFVGPMSDGLLGCHNDGNPANNALTNLRYDTPSGSYADKYGRGTHLQGSAVRSAKLNERAVTEIRGAYASGETQRSIAKRYGVGQPIISEVVTGKRWRHVQVVKPVRRRKSSLKRKMPANEQA